MLRKIYPNDDKAIRKVVEIIRAGGIVIYPTDTVYGIGCDMTNIKAVQKLAKIKGLKLEQANFSIICSDLSNISEYSKVSNSIFKMMKKNLPGAFTFILPATSSVPKCFKNKKKTIGIRVPQHFIPRAIVAELGNPIVTTSVHDDDKIIEYTTDPDLIHEKYGDMVDLVIDGGYGNNEASTIVDCTDGDYEITRQGIGILL